MRKVFGGTTNRKTKRQSVLMALLMLLASCMFGACDPIETTGGGEPTLSIDGTGSTAGAWDENEKAEILLVYRQSNYAWGFYDTGYVIDTRGRFHRYDNGCPRPLDGDDSGDILSFAEYLDVILENDEGVQVFDKEFVEKIAGFGADLTSEDEFTSDHKMCDYGQHTIYYFNPETRKLMKCQSTGDVDQMPKNKSAAKIVELLEKGLQKYSKPATGTDELPAVPKVYSMGECFEMEFEMSILSDWAGKWIVKDTDDLYSFDGLSGIRVSDVLEKMKNSNIEDAVFFITIEDTSKEKSALCSKAFWVSGECCDFVYDKEKVKEADHYICHVAAVKGSELPADLNSIRDLEGQAWTVYSKDIGRQMTIADMLTIEYAKDEEFLAMRVGDEYLLLPGGSQRVFLGDCAGDVQAKDGQILRIVADAEIYNGGEIGYMGDAFLTKVKETKNVTYQDAIVEMEFPDVEGARFWWGELVVKYCEGDQVFFIVLTGKNVSVYWEEILLLRYEVDQEQDILAPFYDLLGTGSGDVELEQAGSGEEKIAYDEDGLPYFANQIIIYSKLGTNPELIEQLAEEIDSDVVNAIPEMDFYLLEFRQDKTYSELMEYVDYFLERQFVMDVFLNYCGGETQPN